ncbi:DUF4157 domain-containing protein [Paenibacillus rigui]|uniref:Flagellar motor protein MotB n=1 Tax=Paenibacillus rigui TaxID=554312 RepID=A0A229UP28_9BACL|nr:DUF4157 domain-containing protein [Paenibacillus rigui]OXM85025.1 flagellar motor protein MotB [Paenibacillus rigui]
MPMYQAPQRKLQDMTTRQQPLSGQTAPAPSLAAESDPMQLQRTFGNHAVGSMLSQGGIGVPGFQSMRVQAKMTVRPAGDSFEQEADQMAKSVVERLSAPAPTVEGIQREAETAELEEEELQLKPAAEGIQREAESAAEGIQREAESAELEEEELQLKPAVEGIQREAESAELEEEELQLKGSGSGFDAAPAIEQEIQMMKGSGSKLDGVTQQKMEGAFQADFSSVNIHTDGRADQVSQAIGARAFTTGSDIFFRQGEYNPESRDGQELLGHELTHVIQQGSGRV